MLLFIKLQKTILFRVNMWILLCVFALNSFIISGNVNASVVSSLPEPGEKVFKSQSFVPCTLKGVTIDSQNSFHLNFIVDPAQETFNDKTIEQESKDLVRYFLAALTVPEGDLWVNLSPYEKDRIIPELFGQTAMGRDLLAQDYLLKQLASSLTYPETELGKQFWDALHSQVYEEFQQTQLPVDTLSKVWIVPGKAVVYQHENTAFVVESGLKVMLKSEEGQVKSEEQDQKDLFTVHSSLFTKIILPAIEQEINEGKNFAKLRQMYDALILAAWYKDTLRESVLNQEYANQNKIDGIMIEDLKDPQLIFDQYVSSFKKGVFNYIKEEYDPIKQQVIPRKYFSGGAHLNVHPRVVRDRAMLNSAQRASINNSDHYQDVDVKLEATSSASFDGAMLSEEDKTRFKDLLNDLVGMEMTDESYQEFIIKDLIELQDPDAFAQSLQRVISQFKQEAFDDSEDILPIMAALLHRAIDDRQNNTADKFLDQQGVMSSIADFIRGFLNKEGAEKDIGHIIYNLVYQKNSKDYFDGFLEFIETFGSKGIPYIRGLVETDDPKASLDDFFLLKEFFEKQGISLESVFSMTLKRLEVSKFHLTLRDQFDDDEQAKRISQEKQRKDGDFFDTNASIKELFLFFKQEGISPVEIEKLMVKIINEYHTAGSLREIEIFWEMLGDYEIEHDDKVLIMQKEAGFALYFAIERYQKFFDFMKSKNVPLSKFGVLCAKSLDPERGYVQSAKDVADINLEGMDVDVIRNYLLELMEEYLTKEDKNKNQAYEIEAKDINRILTVLCLKDQRHIEKVVQSYLNMLGTHYESHTSLGLTLGEMGASLSRIRIQGFLPYFFEHFTSISVPLLVKAYAEYPDLREEYFNNFLDALPIKVIMKYFNVNAKLARYLKNSNEYGEIIEDDHFRKQMDIISYAVNREVTLHPAERRVGEDEKNSLFEYLFDNKGIIDDAQERFDKYFRNSPDQYRVEIVKIVELLQYLPLDRVDALIEDLILDRRQSLDEMRKIMEERLKDDPKKNFIIRKADWILSNLFVLEQRIAQIRPIARRLEKEGKQTADLIDVLNQIHQAPNITQLNKIARKNNLNVVEAVNLKIETISQKAKVKFLANAIPTLNTLQEQVLALDEEQSKNDLYEAVLKYFNSLGQNQKSEVYFLLVNAQLGKKEEDAFYGELAILAQGNKKIKSYAMRFLVDHIVLFSEENKQLAHQDLSEKVDTQILHVYFQPLLELGANDTSLGLLRQLLDVINKDRQKYVNNSALLKNRLYSRFKRMAQFDDASEVFNGIFQSLQKKYTAPSKENSEQFYADLSYYLDKFAKVFDVNQKAKEGLFDEDINEKLLHESHALIEEVRQGRVDKQELKVFVKYLSILSPEILLASLEKGMEIKKSDEFLARLRVFADTPRFKQWVDHEGRDIFEIINVFLKEIEAPEIFKQVYQALKKEMDGKFIDWRYKSPDYVSTLDEIIEIEVEALSDEQKRQLNRAIEEAEGATLYEKLLTIDGFDPIKERIKNIRGWEDNLEEDLGGGLRAVFTDNYFTLFNIGNYDGSTACQSATYGSDLNRGLMGYWLNGSNKALAVVDEDGMVNYTRRIIRLRIVRNAQGKREPVLFIEESDQFGVRYLKELYELAIKLKEKTGLNIVVPHEVKGFEANLREEGGSLMILFNGRSRYDYSDSYGALHPAVERTGLYAQRTYREEVGPFSLYDLDVAVMGQRKVPIDADYGGIDFNLKKIKLEKRGQRIFFDLSPRRPQTIRGLSPVIVDISPAGNLSQLLHLQTNVSK